MASDSRESTLVMKDSPLVEPQIPVSVASVVQSDLAGVQEVGSVWNQDALPGLLSSLIAQLIWAAQEDNPAEVKVPPDTGTQGPPVAPLPGTSAQSPVLEAEPVMLCFSYGSPGHGVNRCSRVDTSFPFLPPGWSVAVQDGQYLAVWPGGPMARIQSGNEGWSASRTSGNSGTTDGMGVTGGTCTWLRLVSKRASFSTIGSLPPVFSPGEHKRGIRKTHVPAQSVVGQADRVVRDSTIEMGGSLPSLFTPVS